MAGQEDKGRVWLYENKYAKTEKHPIKTGPGEISKNVLRKLVEKGRESGDDVVKIQCAAWERVSKQGNPYTFVTIELHEERGQAPQAGSDEIPF